LFKAGRGATLKISEKILSILQKQNKINAKKLAEKLGISSHAVKKNIIKLKKENKLKRVGSNKSRYWEIIN